MRKVRRTAFVLSVIPIRTPQSPGPGTGIGPENLSASVWCRICSEPTESKADIMNYGISVLFRAIPLAMAAFCFAYGAYVFASGDDAGRLTTGPVVFFLGSICIALYCTAATIIRQIIHTYKQSDKYIFPVIGYTCAFITLICGIVIIFSGMAGAAVTGHVVCGLGLITVCVSTAATASSRFSLIPTNSAQSTIGVNSEGFSTAQVTLLTGIAAAAATAAWIWTVVLFAVADTAAHLVAGSVMLGIACVCTSLIALVASIARQIRGTYTMNEKAGWVRLVLGMGAVAFIFGLIMLFAHWGETVDFVGFVLFGLALICWSISSKVILLAKIWHADYPLAKRIPIIPILTALTCMFIAAFLYEEALFKMKFFVPSRVLMGFGAICFTLFSIVSILESGTSKK